MDPLRWRMESVKSGPRAVRPDFSWKVSRPPSDQEASVHAALHSPRLQHPRTTLPPSMLLVTAFAVAAPLSILLAATGAAHRSDPALLILAASALAVGWTARPWASPVVGLLCWLFYDGFDADRWGVLGWDGRGDALRLGLLLAAALLGSLLGTLAPHLREAWAALRTVRRRFRRASLEPFTPPAPSRLDHSYWN